MKFKKINISNFRKLTEISFDCSETITTIVGPNILIATIEIEAG